MRRCGCLIGACGVVYLILNLVLVSCVPLIQKVDLTFSVRNACDKMPIEGASLFVIGGPLPAPVTHWGTTGRDGVLRVDFRFPNSPHWWWPRIGHYRFHTLILRIQADGFEERSYLLANLLSDLTYENPSGNYEIELECDQLGIEFENEEPTRLNNAD